MKTTSRAAMRPVFVLFVLCAAAALIAGCGGGSDSTGSGTTGTSTASVPKTLKVLVGAEFGTIDPNLSVYEQDNFVSGLYVGTLTEYGEGKQGQPELAEKLVPDKSFTKWTVTLKPGLKFSDGSPITADDVTASFERVIEGGGVPYLFTPTIKAVTTTGPLTSVISFATPEPNFPTAASAPAFAIFPAAGLKKGNQFFTQPISAGPYVIDSFKPRSVTLSANPNYAGKKPGPEGVEFSVVEDPGTRLAEVKTGQANFAFDLPAGLIPQMTSPVEKQIQTIPGNYVLLFNNKDQTLSDPRIRRAISDALDREAISNAAFGGEVTPNSRYWPEAFGEFAEAEKSLQEPTPNLAAAEAELKGTACENGCKLNLIGRSSAPWMQTVLLLIQQQLEPLGIEVSQKLSDNATVFEQEEKGEYQMLVDNFLTPVPAEEVLTYVNLKPGPPFNGAYTQFESKKMEEAITRLAHLPVGSRASVAKEIGDLYAQERPWAGLGDLVFINASNLPESVIHGELYSLQIE